MIVRTLVRGWTQFAVNFSWDDGFGQRCHGGVTAPTESEANSKADAFVTDLESRLYHSHSARHSLDTPTAFRVGSR